MIEGLAVFSRRICASGSERAALPRRPGFGRVILPVFAALIFLSGCANSGGSRYNHTEVGKATLVEFGQVVAVRPIKITGRNSGAGAVAGGTAGGLIGTQIGQGNGGIAGILGGIIIGTALGAAAERVASNRDGTEYAIVLSNGKTVVIPQEKLDGDAVFKSGDRVMVQVSGTYQRVLTADHLPDEVTRPKGIAVRD